MTFRLRMHPRIRLGFKKLPGRYPGSRVLTHRLPMNMFTVAWLMRPHSLTVAGAAQGLRNGAHLFPV